MEPLSQSIGYRAEDGTFIPLVTLNNTYQHMTDEVFGNLIEIAKAALKLALGDSLGTYENGGDVQLCNVANVSSKPKPLRVQKHPILPTHRVVWTLPDAQMAGVEGWGLFETIGGNGLQLQKVDEADTFKEDLDAWRHVVGKSQEPFHLGTLHRRALNYLQQENPLEYKLIQESASFTTRQACSWTVSAALKWPTSSPSMTV